MCFKKRSILPNHVFLSFKTIAIVILGSWAAKITSYCMCWMHCQEYAPLISFFMRSCQCQKVNVQQVTVFDKVSTTSLEVYHHLSSPAASEARWNRLPSNLPLSQCVGPARLSGLNVHRFLFGRCVVSIGIRDQPCGILSLSSHAYSTEDFRYVQHFSCWFWSDLPGIDWSALVCASI